MDFLILRPLPPKTGYHFFEGGGVGGGGGGGQKFLLNRLQTLGTHGAGNTVSGPIVTQPTPDVQASVRLPASLLLVPLPPAAAQKGTDLGSNRRSHGHHSAALPLGHYAPPCCLGPHLPLTKNPNCVYLSDCLLAGSGTDWLTVNLSSRCTAEGNRIFLDFRQEFESMDPHAHANGPPLSKEESWPGPLTRGRDGSSLDELWWYIWCSE